MFNAKISFTIGLATRGGKYLAPTDVLDNSAVPELAKLGIDGFTVINNLGYWEGKPEYSLTVSVLVGAEHPLTTPSVAEALAAKLAEQCDQTCVLWEIAPVVGGLGYSAKKEA